MRLRRPRDPGAIVVAVLLSIVCLGCALALAYFLYQVTVIEHFHLQ
jgi:hypothetical protein